MVGVFSDILINKDNKCIEYVQSGLRSAQDILQHGGNVMVKHKDQKYSFDYDNKRRILETRSDDGGFYDSTPWHNITQYSKIRILKETVSTPVYTGFSTQPSKKYKSSIETVVRGFIKACLCNVESMRYGIPINMFPTYKSLIDFIYSHEPARVVKLTSSCISHLKNRNTITRAVPRTKENELFITHVMKTIKTFDSELFFRELSEEARKRKKESKKESKKKVNKDK